MCVMTPSCGGVEYRRSRVSEVQSLLGVKGLPHLGVEEWGRGRVGNMRPPIWTPPAPLNHYWRMEADCGESISILCTHIRKIDVASYKRI